VLKNGFKSERSLLIIAFVLLAFSQLIIFYYWKISCFNTQIAGTPHKSVPAISVPV